MRRGIHCYQKDALAVNRADQSLSDRVLTSYCSFSVRISLYWVYRGVLNSDIVVGPP